MGCCCGKPTVVENSDNLKKEEEERKRNEANNNRKSKANSRLSRKSKVSALSTFTSNAYEYTDRYEEEEINPPKYFSFRQYFEEVDDHLLNGYNFIRLIGTGAMSSVYQVEEESTEEILAAKVYNMSQLCKPTLGNEEAPIIGVQREIELMKNMSHLYILSILDAFDFYDLNSRFLIFPFAGLGNLQSLIDQKSIEDDHITVCFHQTALGLQYMHSLNIVHRDIKPENILCFSESYFVLSDFSVSSQMKDDQQFIEDTKGSPAFLSPEECSGDPFLPKPADVWAYGVSLYSSIFGFLPYKLGEAENRSIANTVIVVTDMLQTQKLTFPKKTINNNSVDKDLIALLRDVLNKDPTKRPSFDQIVKYKCFKDAWPIHEANVRQDQLLAEEENRLNENQDNPPD